MSTPQLEPGILVCVLWSGQECCNETMHNIPVYSDIGESLERRCVCVNVWYVCTMLGSLFRKDWACKRVHSWNEQLILRRNRHHGSWKENDVRVEIAQDLLTKKKIAKEGQNMMLLARGRISSWMNCVWSDEWICVEKETFRSAAFFDKMLLN